MYAINPSNPSYVLGDKGYFSGGGAGFYYNNIHDIGSFTTENFTTTSTAIYKVKYSVTIENGTPQNNLPQIHFLLSNNSYISNNSSNSNGYLNNYSLSLSNNNTTLGPDCPTLVSASLNGPQINISNSPTLSYLFSSPSPNYVQAGFYNNNLSLCNFGMCYFGGSNNITLNIEMYAVLQPNTTYYVCTFVGKNGVSGNYTGYGVCGTYEYFLG